MKNKVMEEKEFLKRISKISESYEEILMLLSKTETKGEKSYRDKCIELITKKPKNYENKK
jgi:hypothetical protein